MENVLEGLGMGAAAIAAAGALSLLYILAGHYERLLDVTAEKMQQNPVVAETAYE